jgi:hypothetical protein
MCCFDAISNAPVTPTPEPAVARIEPPGPAFGRPAVNSAKSGTAARAGTPHPGFAHSASKTRVNALKAQPGLQAAVDRQFLIVIQAMSLRFSCRQIASA